MCRYTTTWAISISFRLFSFDRKSSQRAKLASASLLLSLYPVHFCRYPIAFIPPPRQHSLYSASLSLPEGEGEGEEELLNLLIAGLA